GGGAGLGPRPGARAHLDLGILGQRPPRHDPLLRAPGWPVHLVIVDERLSAAVPKSRAPVAVSDATIECCPIGGRVSGPVRRSVANGSERARRWRTSVRAVGATCRGATA